MKNVTIKVPFDEAKLSALRYFLEEKNVFLEDEVEQFLSALYQRTVPKQMHGYVEDMAAKATKQAHTRPARPRADSDS